MKKLLIGVTGLARAGKTTVSDHLWAEQGFTHMSFAGALKQAAKQIFGLTVDQMKDENKEVLIPYWGLSPRQIYQKLGTEAVRGVFGGDVWVKRLALTLAEVRNSDDVVIGDVRFAEEAHFIRSQGGVIVRIVRDGAGLAGAEAAHASEVGNLDADYVLDNNVSFEALYGQIDTLLTTLKG